MSELHIDAQGNVTQMHDMDIENKPERPVTEVSHQTAAEPSQIRPLRQNFNLAQLRAMAGSANRSTSVPLQNPVATNPPTEEKAPVVEDKPVEVMKEEPKTEPAVEVIPEPAVEVEKPVEKDSEPAVEVEPEQVAEVELAPSLSMQDMSIEEKPVEVVVREEPTVEPAPVVVEEVKQEEVEEVKNMNLVESAPEIPTVKVDGPIDTIYVCTNDEVAKIVGSSVEEIRAWVKNIVLRKPSWVNYGATILESKQIAGLRLYNCNKTGKNSCIVTIGAGEMFSGVVVEGDKYPVDASSLLSSTGHSIGFGGTITATTYMASFETYKV